MINFSTVYLVYFSKEFNDEKSSKCLRMQRYGYCKIHCSREGSKVRLLYLLISNNQGIVIFIFSIKLLEKIHKRLMKLVAPEERNGGDR